MTLGIAGVLALHFTSDGVTYRGLEASLDDTTAALDDGQAPSVQSSYDLSAHQTLSRVILLVREHYVDPERVDPYDMFMAALDEVERAVPEILVDDAKAPERIAVAVAEQKQTFDLGGLDQLWEVTMALRDIFRFLQGHITDGEQRRDVEYAAINGMLSTLDPHSVLLEPESFNEVKTSTKGEFGGLGIVISIRDGRLTVISPIEGTPASRSGLKAQDTIVKIGEESTINMSLEEAVQRLRGKPGTDVAIWIKREGWADAKKFTLTRAIIKIESVTSKLLEGGVGYVRIKSFQNNTYDDLHTHLEQLRKKKGSTLEGLVLDLRNNPGGLLDQAILVSDRFVERGPLVITVGEGNRRREVKRAHFSGSESDYPIAVLVNGGSASASEIVAGALKNHDRGVVLGQPTFGKGSVQVLYDFKDRSALKLTIAQYLTPGDVSIQSVGITPDVQIDPAYINGDRLHLFVHDQAPREKDLDRHLERHEASRDTRAKPAVKLVNLMEEPDAQDRAAMATDEFQSDFQIELAKDIVARAPTANRKTALKSAKKLFAQRSDEQQKRIAKRLEEQGLDWTGAPKMAKTTPKVTVDFNAEVRTGSEAKKKGPRSRKTNKQAAEASGGPISVQSGETLTFTATVNNTGTAPVYRVYGITDSENPLLDNLEFAFGKIPAGKRKSWQVDFEVPAELSSRADLITLKITNPTDSVRATAKRLIAFKEKPKPRFAYRYRLDDIKGGNGDGVLQKGETVDLVVDVTNLGPGTAEDAMATLKNLSGKAVFLDRGRAKLGKLEPKGREDGVLRFALQQEAEKVEVRLSVWDAVLGASVSERLEFPVVSAREPKKNRQTLQVSAADAPVPVRVGAAEQMPIAARVAPGRHLLSDLSFSDGWHRVMLADKRRLFVHGSAVKPTQKKLKATPPKVLSEVEAQSAPVLDVKMDELVTKASSLTLRGKVSDERYLKDIFAFVNEEKVFYDAIEKAADDDKPVNQQFKLELPLEEGSNTVSLVVRESEELIARRVFSIYRDAGEGLAATQGANSAN